MEKSYRLHTDIGVDGVLNVNMRQDIDFWMSCLLECAKRTHTSFILLTMELLSVGFLQTMLSASLMPKSQYS